LDLREFLVTAEALRMVDRLQEPFSPRLQIAQHLLAHDGRISFFEQITGAPGYRLVGGCCSDRRFFGVALGCEPDQLLVRLSAALANPQEPSQVACGPCQEVIEPAVDLLQIPFLTHYASDGGAYASAAVLFVNDPETGPNASFHRLLRLDSRHLVARLVENRGAERAWRKSLPAGRELPVAIAIGLPIHCLLAASLSPQAGVDELSLAAALAPTPVVACANGIRVAAAAEIVLEGRITGRLASEGPFVDLTGTYDFVREQPVIEIDRITHRRDPIYQALLPGRLEHRLLMGMPKEPTIWEAVNQVTRCLNVHVTPGGASWLHAVVQIDKQDAEDGMAAGAAAFKGHPSLKHVIVVDGDIDLFSPAEVEWAVATRFQAGRDLQVWRNQPSSSLDPSAIHAPGQKSRTDKMALDATIPWDMPTGPSNPAAYRRVAADGVYAS
jgi:2,5-furandicarboxylate decarboxylase 1